MFTGSTDPQAGEPIRNSSRTQPKSITERSDENPKTDTNAWRGNKT